MDDKKIAFISCVNNETMYQVALRFMKSLWVPPGYQVEHIQIRDAVSLTSGYNRGMKQTNAKYKVYLHQDVYILQADFISQILRLFTLNPRLGMLGMAGGQTLPSNGLWTASPQKFGRVFGFNPDRSGLFTLDFLEVPGEYVTVKSIDGLMMITQYDIPWREDLIPGWHFYDISQSMEFIRAGYEVGIPRQPIPWCIHDCEIDLDGYESNRLIFVNHYADLLDK